jgi:hypothetical protein
MAALLLVLPSVPQGRAQVSAYPSAQVLVEVHESVAYDLYGSAVSQVYGSVNGTISPIDSFTTIQIISNIRPFSANLTYLAKGITTSEPEAPAYTAAQAATYTIVLPAHTTSFRFSILGSTTGVELLWRYLGSVPTIEITGLGVPTSYVTRIVIPSGTVLSQEYGPGGESLPLSYAVSPSNESGYSSYSVEPDVSLVVLQSTLFLPASVAVTSAALVVIVLAALGLFGRGRRILQRLKRSLLSLVSILHPFSLRRLRPGFRFRNLFQPRKLLVLFLLCALLMASAAAIGGPDPRLKAYVVASPSEVAGIQENLEQVAGNTLVVTPTQDYSDFAVMSSVGQFELAVFSSYPPAGTGQVEGYIMAGLANVPVIVVDNSTNLAFAKLIETTYLGKVLQVRDASALSPAEQSELASLLHASSRTNLFGLNLSVRDFNALLALEAVLSILLVFFGFCYLGSLASESSSQTDLTHLVTVLGAGIFVFVFSEALYVTVSSLLAFPLSLHAVISGAHYLTAVGLLGFGGGSTPRLAAGFLGVLIGVVGARGSPPIEKSDLALVLGVGLVLLANPFSIGQFVFQGLVLFLPLGNLAFGAAYVSSQSLKGFIYGIGSALGAGVTPTYLMSAGKMLFFAGLVPLAYLRKMGRTTTVIALLLVALFVGDGGVRIGEMTPDKTVIAILPGLVIGFVFAFLILGLASIEKYVRGVWRPKG